MFKLVRYAPEWGRGTVYYYFDSKAFQVGFFKTPWRFRPRFFFAKKKAK